MLLRRLYTTSTKKVPISLIAELRKQTTVSLSKAREALSSTDGSIPAALSWLEKDLVSTGAAKAAKVSSRETKEGLVAQSVLSATAFTPGTEGGGGGGKTAAVGGIRAALIELNCETDFVARNALFATLAADIAHTAAFFSEPSSSPSSSSSSPLSLKALSTLPLIPHAEPNTHTPGTTIASAIRDTIVKVGENISLRRATALVHSLPPPSSSPTPSTILRLASYTHSPLHALPAGPSSVLALLKISSPALLPLWRSSSSPSESGFPHTLGILERSIARQIIAFPTSTIHPSSSSSLSASSSTKGTEPEPETQNAEEQALYTQPFITLPGPLNGLSVREALDKWAITHGLSEEGAEGAIEVLEFVKWSVGEPLPESEPESSPEGSKESSV